MNDIYVVYYWPDFEDSPEVIEYTNSFINGDYWDDDVYALDFGYYQTHFLS